MLIKTTFNKKAFTLIELLIVVLIIGILAAIALPQYQLARDKAEFQTYRSLVKAITEAQRRYYLSTGIWTSQVNDLDVTLPEGGTPVAIASYANGILFEKWYCYLTSYRAGSANAGVYCGNNSYWGNYEWTASSSGILLYNLNLCIASASDARTTRLCKALDGSNYTSGGLWGPEGSKFGFTYYKLP